MWITSSRLYTLWSKSNNSNWMLHTGSNILQRPTHGQIKLDSIVSDSIPYGELMRGIYLITIITYGDNLCLVEWSMICKKCLHLIQVYIGCPPPPPIYKWVNRLHFWNNSHKQNSFKRFRWCCIVICIGLSGLDHKYDLHFIPLCLFLDSEWCCICGCVAL